MKEDLDYKKPLKICAIGSSRDCHTRNRVVCFSQRGHDVTIITDQAVGIPGVKEIVPISPKASKIKKAHPVFDYYKAIKHCKPDIIHVHYAQMLSGWMAAVVDQHPLVVNAVGGDVLFDEQFKPTGICRKLTVRFLREADLILAKSNYLKSILNRFGGLEEKTMRVIWGVKPAQFRKQDVSALKAKLGIGNDEKVILSPKILVPFYNIHLIIQALVPVKAKFPKIRLILTEYNADSKYKKELQALAARLNLEKNILFVGEIAHQDMADYYNLADVVVSVPESDGFPQSVLEAMACEVPNIILRLPHYEELVKNEENIFYVEKTPDSISQGIIRLFSDKNLYHTIRSNGLETVKKHANFDLEVERVEKYFYELLQKPYPQQKLLHRLKTLVMIYLYLTERTILRRK